MDDLNTYLDYIQEDKLNEFDPFSMAAIVVTSKLVVTLAYFLFLAAAIRKSLKVDKDLSKRMNEILNSGDHWIVHNYPDATPNAFALGMGRHIFITDGLKSILTQREIEAVLLHEIQHNKGKDTYKHMAFKHSFYYLVTTLALTVSSVSYPLAILSFLILVKATNIAASRIVGRRAEIKADKFTVQYGYGKDLITSLEKIDKYMKKIYTSKPCGKFCQLERKISETLDEHPTTKARVEMILKSIEKTKDMSFPKIKEFVSKALEEGV